MWRRIAHWLCGTSRCRPLACITLAAFAANLGCDACDGHDPYSDELWCDNDRVLVCRWESAGNRVETVDQCMPGGCYKNPATGGVGCRVPNYICPEGVTGYQCLAERRIECGANGVAWDHNDCSQYIIPDAPPRHCVENPGGEILACGYTNERCATPGEVRCLGEGTVVCRDSVWQAFVPSAKVGQSVCDASSVRYDMLGCSHVDFTWCEEDQVRRCDRCVDYRIQGTDEYLCASFTSLVQCEPGACSSHYDDSGFPEWLTGCSQDAVECSAAGQSVCIGDRPGYCLAEGVVAVDRRCSEIWDVTPTCEMNLSSVDPKLDRVTCTQ